MARTCRHRSESRAARIRDDFPVPASPISTVSDFAARRPYCKVLNASRCRGVRNRNFGLAVSSNGGSERPKKDSYIERPLRPQPPDDQYDADDHERGRAGYIHDPTAFSYDLALAVRAHHRNQCEHGQREPLQDFLFAPEARVAQFKKTDYD